MKKFAQKIINLKLLITLILIGGIFVISKNAYDVFAYVTSSELNTQINELTNTIIQKEQNITDLKEKSLDYQENIIEKQSQINSLADQLAVMNNRIAKKKLDIEIKEEEISAAQDKIKEKQLAINAQNEKIKRQKEKIIDFIRLIYKNDERTYLEILILNDNFSQFFNYIQFTKDIEYSIKDTLDGLVNLKNLLEKDKDILEYEKINLEKLKLALEEEKINLEEEKERKEILLAQTEASEILFKKLLKNIKEDQISADIEIKNLEKRKRELIAKNEELKTKLDGDASLSWPISPRPYITSYFHDPEYPYRYLFEHPGIDLRAKQKTPIKAPASGYVGRIKDGGKYGYSYITIIHGKDISTVYGHVSKIYIEEDKYVERGEVIGLSGGMPGTNGAGRFTTGPHLHFEVRYKGIPVDPLQYLP